MSTRVKNTIGIRRGMEARALKIGLNAFGSYVLPSLDPAEFAHVQSVDFDKLTFLKEELVVVAHGKLGSLARFAQVTSDLRYARFFGRKYISIALIEAQVFSKEDFIRSIASNPTLRVLHVQTCKEYVGILHGEITRRYKTLVYLNGERLDFLDLEENPPPQASHMQVRILESIPDDKMVMSALADKFL